MESLASRVIANQEHALNQYKSFVNFDKYINDEQRKYINNNIISYLENHLYGFQIEFRSMKLMYDRSVEAETTKLRNNIQKLEEENLNLKGENLKLKQIIKPY